jgi:hypothetical protein
MKISAVALFALFGTAAAGKPSLSVSFTLFSVDDIFAFCVF